MAAEVEPRRREWLTLGSAVVLVLGGLLGGMKLVVAPLHAEVRAINGRLDQMNARLGRMEGRLDRMDGRMDRIEGSVTGLRDDMAEVRERLIRVESLIEQESHRTDTPQ